MRSFARPLLAALLLAVTPAQMVLAQSSFWSADEQTSFDVLFENLRIAPDEPTARAIAEEIWALWTQPDDKVVAARFAAIVDQFGLGGPGAQIPLMDALIADYPDYPEGWNLRATAKFFNGDYEGSLADITETLAREPRHFGALAGRVLIFHTLGRREEALAAVKAALEIHPFLSERGLFPELSRQ